MIQLNKETVISTHSRSKEESLLGLGEFQDI